MAGLSWDQMNSGEDVVVLPPRNYQTNRKGNKTTFTEVSYTQEEDGTIIRLERKGEITKKEKRVSHAAKKRQENFIKFGAVSGKPLGEREKGITETRLEEFTVLWEGGLSKQDQKEKQRRANLQRQKEELQQKRAQQQLMTEEEKINNAAVANMRRQPPPMSQEPARKGYVAPGLRNNTRDGGRGGYGDEEEITYEIRISNLPDSTQQDDIRNMMFSFFNQQYHQLPWEEKSKLLSPPSGRIKVYCFKSRAEGDTNAIVDVKSEFWQQKCIQLLDGESYGYNIIKVEKSKPKRRKY